MFTLWWHRAGNSAKGIDAVVHAAREDSAAAIAGRRVRHGVECDLKWTPGAHAQGAPLLYLHHGPTGLERLSRAEVERRAAEGELLLLGDALARPGAAELAWMVELKRGHGPTAAAVSACVAAFDRHEARSRLLFASSSLAVLEEVRAAHADVRTGLFVSWIFRDGRVLQVPKVEVASALRRGLVHRAESLAAVVDLVICTNPLAAGRALPTGTAQAPIARSLSSAHTFAKAGLSGAFTWFPPSAVSGSARPGRG